MAKGPKPIDGIIATVGRPRPNGSGWRVPVTTTDGKRHWRGFPTEAAAREWMRSLQPAQAAAALVADGPPADLDELPGWWCSVLAQAAARLQNLEHDPAAHGQLAVTLRAMSAAATASGRWFDVKKMRRELDELLGHAQDLDATRRRKGA